jgi:DNA adenine methylase
MESSNFQRVAPVRPVAPYIGGKRNLAKRLVALIETIPHKTYAEPFVGMGGVFLRRSLKPQAEVINDWSREVSNLYRVLQVHYVAFLDWMRFQLTTRAEFERLVGIDPETLTDLQRAARFLYLQKTAFGGKVTGRNFGVSHHRGGAFDLSKLAPMLEDLHVRMSGVIIERLPWQAFVARYDTAETLFYLDPPYWGSEDDYGAELFGRDQFAAMAEQLATIKGRFVLSLNDTPGVRETFRAFELEEVTTTYTLSGQAQRAGELIITGGRAAA